MLTFSNQRETLFEFSVDKQHWKHSICDKSLFILMFLSYRKNSNKGPPEDRAILVLMQNLSRF